MRERPASRWRGRPWERGSIDPAAHPNGRFAVPLENNPALSPFVNDPNWTHGANGGGTLFRGWKAPAPGIADRRAALDMRAFLDELRARTEDRSDFRIGVNSGPLVGGVSGLRKFVFDLWADPVSIASRMESHGVPGRIRVSDPTDELLREEFDLEPPGTIEVKEKGQLRTWFLLGERPAPAAPRAPEPAITGGTR